MDKKQFELRKAKDYAEAGKHLARTLFQIDKYQTINDVCGWFIDISEDIEELIQFDEKPEEYRYYPENKIDSTYDHILYKLNHIRDYLGLPQYENTAGILFKIAHTTKSFIERRV